VWSSSKHLLLLALVAGTASASWLEQVSPIISAPERKVYLSLPDDASRAKFQEQFWNSKEISAGDYFTQLAYVDSVFGSGKLLSGTHTDRGRMYLALGPPQKISRLNSTRSFFPLEIWYYDTAPNIGVSHALQFMFFQRNGAGDYKVYSPILDTVRALLNPQASTRGAFRVNDILTEADIRNTLNLTPAEQEIVDAAIGVARGITGGDNEKIIGFAMSPELALNKSSKTKVTSRLVPEGERPALTVFQSWSDDGIPIVDLSLESRVKNKIGLAVSTEEAETVLPVLDGKRVRYQHRLYLLPGSYTVTFRIDGQMVPFPLQVSAQRETSVILLAGAAEAPSATPFEFGGMHVQPDSNGKLALVQMPRPRRVKWFLRKGAGTVWSTESEPGPGGLVTAEFKAPPGRYKLEMVAGDESRECEVQIGKDASAVPVISYNANLSADERARSIGRQWLARGHLVEARTWLEHARSIRQSDDLTVDLCRVNAMAGDLDTPRSALREILQRSPDHFEALTVLGFIEAKLQDYSVAAQYYKKALAVRNSPAIAQALAEVSKLNK
jgi:GWxTD domain-containing protein